MSAHIGILIYPGVTALDALGPAEVFCSTPGVKTWLIARDMNPVRTDAGWSLLPQTTLRDAPTLDVICVPGGPGQVDLMCDAETLEWLRDRAEEATWITSVCTGSLLLAAAGLLRGRRAACHWSAIEQLALFDAIPTRERVVQDGPFLTGGGVTAGIDMALTVVARWLGEPVAQAVQLGLEYAPAPPFDAGTPERAPAEVLALVRGAMTRRTARRLAMSEHAARRLADRRGAQP